MLLHILTKKGKGYEPALAKPDKFHGLGKYKIESGETAPAPTPTYSEILGKTLGKFADTNRKIVAITGAMPSGTGLGFFQAQHPDRYFDVGIAEEHAALFACGLATQGLKPFLTIYSTFMQRAYDMIIHDIALQNLNVALCMDRAGLSGDDGPTHHGLFDIGYLRHVPNIVHMQPKDEDEFVRHALDDGALQLGPDRDSLSARRWHRREAEGRNRSCSRSARPKSCSTARTSRFSVSATCSRWRRKPRRNWRRRASPSRSSIRAGSSRLDTGTLEFFARSVQVVCTIEDHVLHNGFGCGVMEHLHTQMINTPVVRIGWPDQFIEHGTIPILRKKHGLTSDALVEKVLPLLQRRKEQPRPPPPDHLGRGPVLEQATAMDDVSVLELPPVESAQTAVRAAITSDQQE